ncbi:hypothetical protein [Streptomyces catenulae]|uniref:Uncharacterized protein n=1 Tax=Streptomyces catenulae TaxID=66875 RepID=A0ABV2YT23_9ACTN|nr:hypothetical protein [Streptomyces catenulae]
MAVEPSPSHRSPASPPGRRAPGAPTLTAAGRGEDGVAGREAEPGDSWVRLLADADPVWRRLPAAWQEAPFLGNALLGSWASAEPDGHAVRFTVQQGEVPAQRPESGAPFGPVRPPVGHFTLTPCGAVTAADWRLRLREAELTGTLTTDRGTLTVRALVHTARPVLAVEVVPSAGERAFRWRFRPAGADGPEGDTGPPPVRVEEHAAAHAAVRPLPDGGAQVTAWRERADGYGARTLYAAVVPAHPDRAARRRALRVVRDATAEPYDALAADHRSWWHTYFHRGLRAVADSRLQRNDGIQLYRAAFLPPPREGLP